MRTHDLTIQRRLAPLLRITIVVAMLSMISFSAPSNPSPKQVVQAWVFDGAYLSSDTFGVALTDQGLQAHVENASTCPGTGLGTTTGFVALSPAQQGVFTMTPALPLGFGPDFDPNFFLPPPPNPFDPNLVETDCDALQHEANVASYINARQAEIAALDAQISACTQDIHAMACQVLEKIELTEAVCSANPARCSFPDPSSSGITAAKLTVGGDYVFEGDQGHEFSSSCRDCRQGLSSLPIQVSSAQKALAACESAKSPLQAQLNTLQTFLAGNGQLPLDPNKLGSGPAAAIDAAEAARDSMDAILTDFADSGAPCRHDELVASCNECSTGVFPGEIPPLVPTGAVRVEQSARHLGRLAATFHLTSNRTTDPNLRARYAAFATRLRTLPDARVLNVTAPSAEPLSQSFVALRRSNLPDDGRSPLAVVLTLLGSRRPCPPELNLADRQLLDQALETFKRTLGPNRQCSTCDPPR